MSYDMNGVVILAIKKVRLSDQAFDEIKKMIRKKNFLPGEKFYSENELARLLAVSRSSVREAIRLLEVSGFVTVKHGKGIFITDSNHKGNQSFAEWLRENETSLTEHFEIRLIIDPKAASYAAEKADESDIRKLQDICDHFRLLSDSEDATADLVKLDEQFHLQLAKSTKNRTLYMMMKTMTHSLPEGWISSLNVPGRIRKTVTEHCAIVDAIRAHDRKAAEIRMEEHISNALSDIRSSMTK